MKDIMKTTTKSPSSKVKTAAKQIREILDKATDEDLVNMFDMIINKLNILYYNKK